MMFRLLTFAVVCGLSAAQVTECPGGDVSCGEGQTCCFSNGRFTCCALIEDPRIVLGSPSFAYNSSSSETPATASSTESTSPASSTTWKYEWDFCPYTIGKKMCCTEGDIYCYDDSDCCSNKKCCIQGSRCCGNGEWCCKEPLKCGETLNSCYSGAAGVYPVVGLVLAAIVSLLFNGRTISS